MSERVRREVRVFGTVQGVGFRPFVFGLAQSTGLSGFVLNDDLGVLIEVEGARETVDLFVRRLMDEPPVLAVIERVEQREIAVGSDNGFEVRESSSEGAFFTPISPDVATCAECIAEIFDPDARRYRYAFTNCTNCGPRFTISTGIPYDRERTTMAPFEMCSACKAEYEDPSDRRFHAQPIACPACGPQLKLVDPQENPLPGDAIERAAQILSTGGIVAIKGLGGFHLACDATDGRAVDELRRRKRREEKPFAVMAPTFESACRVAAAAPEETMTMGSRARPIVLVPRRSDAPIADSVAPRNRFVGLMLPYTPLHHLLLSETRRPLVMTSGNLSEEPIAHRDEDAFARLADVADAFLVHDRPIHIRCDDSVVRVLSGREYPIRRSRGYAPAPLTTPLEFTRPTIGAGAELKHTFCLGRDRSVIPSHHIGDLTDYETMNAFTEAVDHYTSIFGVTPEVVAHDLHPEYLSTKWALDSGLTSVGVQHHHAHIAACLTDNDRLDRVIGLALDGTGFGTDGAIWGCEVLVCDARAFDRFTHLRYVPLPGGDGAVRAPWRMAAVYLNRVFGREADDLDLGCVRRNARNWNAVLQMAERGVNSPLASSAGRLFDAVASLCDVRDVVRYEGQAAAELEQAVDPNSTRSYPTGSGDDIDGAELVGAAVDDLLRGSPVGEVATGFHNGLATGLASACERARAATGIQTVALSGGTWQNLVLLRATRMKLEQRGFEVLVHRRVPPNDGGICVGQALVAAATMTSGSREGVGEPADLLDGR